MFEIDRCFEAYVLVLRLVTYCVRMLIVAQLSVLKVCGLDCDI